LESRSERRYHLLCKGNMVDDYIVPCFDVLHTFSKDYIADDIVALLKKREVLNQYQSSNYEC
jgi:hypothetical protein